ncbi:hypothetical protein [Rhizomicrobium electricum]|uniref:Chemotaxis protein n=1 Tax=Rhizomicrobium electricum TaxID=480070 RepID=A0ABN1EL77_9PROT|nr:hypothetical protein [Rhizomicrobium electricum]NIJ47056.1 hypothetical protein [Rhizomicrobium electricum]
MLTQAIEGIDALVASLEKLVEALDEKAVAAASSDLRAAAKSLNDLAENHRTRQHAIEDLGRHRETLAKYVSDMRASLAYMRAFTVNIKIVSSGIAEAGSTFESFAQEISDCIESGREELRQMDEELMGLQEGLASALIQGATLTTRIGTLLPVLPNELSESAGLMGEHYARVSAVAGDVAGIARNIQKRVVRVLQALQIGDITRQRIEHVQDSIRRLQTDPELQGYDGRLMALGYGLLEQQLKSTIEEFHQEVTVVEAAMADMGAHSRELLKLRDMAYGGKSGGGFLADLGGRIDQAFVLVNEIEEADSSALRTGQETAAAANQLGKRIAAVQGLKNDVQYMALNTTIKCAQIGDAAKPLSVIAIELRDHGRHLETAAAAGLSELDELTGAAGSLATARDGEGRATDALGVAANLIRDARQRTEAEVGTLVLRGEELLAVIDSSTSRLAFREEIGDTLEMVADALTGRAACAPQDASGLEDHLAEMLEQFGSLYTMAQERNVHNDFVDSIGAEYAEVHEAIQRRAAAA